MENPSPTNSSASGTSSSPSSPASSSSSSLAAEELGKLVPAVPDPGVFLDLDKLPAREPLRLVLVKRQRPPEPSFDELEQMLQAARLDRCTTESIFGKKPFDGRYLEEDDLYGNEQPTKAQLEQLEAEEKKDRETLATFVKDELARRKEDLKRNVGHLPSQK
ncbi:hypothetical protein DL98DRAFT_582370 [Cadophora sp. DSE1049]|nr:hypothetical protein DL98DRAFT_582370 [Cadophora sp. DSE1049]